MLHYSLWEMPVRGRTVTRNLKDSHCLFHVCLTMSQLATSISTIYKPWQNGRTIAVSVRKHCSFFARPLIVLSTLRFCYQMIFCRSKSWFIRAIVYPSGVTCENVCRQPIFIAISVTNSLAIALTLSLALAKTSTFSIVFMLMKVTIQMVLSLWQTHLEGVTLEIPLS